MSKKVISTKRAPEAVGPYSQAVEINGFVYTAGMVPINPETGEIPEGLEAQAEQAIKNLVALLEDAGVKKTDIIKTTIYIKDMDYFGILNDIYERYFEKPYPARTCVEVSRLPKDVLMEIEAIGVKE